MSYFDDESNKMDSEEQGTEEGAAALAREAMSKEDRAAEKARLKREKELEKEKAKRDKQEKKKEKLRAKGLFVPDDDDFFQRTAERVAEREAEREAELKSEKKGGSLNHSEEAPGTAEAQVASADSKEIKIEIKKENKQDNINNTDNVKESETAEKSETAEPQNTDLQTDSGEKKKKSRRRSRRKSDEQVKPEDVNIVKDLLSLIIYIGIVVLICFLIVTYVGRRTTVNGDSMNPTLQSGDSLWVNKLAYKFGDPERYDIIVFPYADDVNYIKRIIGLPGETVQIMENGDILIDGKVLQEPNKFNRMVNPGAAAKPITLGPDEYFVLGDNRNNSRDSRYTDVGNIKREKIVGKAVFRLTPLKNFGSIY